MEIKSLQDSENPQQFAKKFVGKTVDDAYVCPHVDHVRINSTNGRLNDSSTSATGVVLTVNVENDIITSASASEISS